MESENRHCFHAVPQYYRPAGCSGSQQIGKPPSLQAVLPAIGKDWENSTVAKKKLSTNFTRTRWCRLKGNYFSTPLNSLDLSGTYFVGDKHVSSVGDGFNLLSFKLLNIWYQITRFFVELQKVPDGNTCFSPNNWLPLPSREVVIMGGLAGTGSKSTGGDNNINRFIKIVIALKWRANFGSKGKRLARRSYRAISEICCCCQRD